MPVEANIPESLSIMLSAYAGIVAGENMLEIVYLLHLLGIRVAGTVDNERGEHFEVWGCGSDCFDQYERRRFGV